jgi:glucose-1-phosphate cytidylyltransferase
VEVTGTAREGAILFTSPSLGRRGRVAGRGALDPRAQRNYIPALREDDDVKAMILAGGLGTRLAEETTLRPKPLVEIGGQPVLWHIMKIYAHHDVTDFIICLGHKGAQIKQYFTDYFLRNSDITLNLSTNRITFHQSRGEDWNVTLVDTGEETMTGGRVKRAARYLGDDREFCMTYADGVSDIDIERLIRFHRDSGLRATVTAARPPGRFGQISMNQGRVTGFREKPPGESWVNAGYFVLSRDVIDYIDGDHTVWEQEPLTRLSAEGQLAGYQHEGFWRCMDTIQDRRVLEQLWAKAEAPWKVW